MYKKKKKKGHYSVSQVNNTTKRSYKKNLYHSLRKYKKPIVLTR